MPIVALEDIVQMSCVRRVRVVVRRGFRKCFLRIERDFKNRVRGNSQIQNRPAPLPPFASRVVCVSSEASSRGFV